MSDTCESCGCPEGVDGHDVLYRQIDELKKAAPHALNNLSKALGSMDAEERSMLCKRITELEKAINKADREISEAVRVGAGRGEECALAAHRTLTGTGAVIGYTTKVQS